MTLEERIYQLPGENGWWKKSSLDTFCEAGEKLKSNGFTDDDAYSLLVDLYFAAVGCYGS